MAARQFLGGGVSAGTTLTAATAGSGDTAFSGGVSGTMTLTDGWLTVPSDTTSRSAKWPGVATSTGRSLRCYYRPGATAATVPILTLYGPDGTTVIGYIGVNGASQFVLRNAANSSVTAGIVGYAAGTLYRLEVAAGAAAGSVWFRVYEVDEGAGTESLILTSGDQALGTSTYLSTWAIGRMSSTAAGPGQFGFLRDVDTALTQLGPENFAGPVVSVTGSQSAAAGASVTATASASDADGIGSYAWSVLRYSASAVPTAVTPTSGAASSACTWTAGAAGTLDVATCVVTDAATAPKATTVTTEVRVPLVPDGTAKVYPAPLWGYSPVVTGTFARTGGTSDGSVLADASDATLLTSASVSAAAQEHRHRLQPCPAGLSSLTVTDRHQTDTGTATSTVLLYEGPTAGTLRATGTATTVSTTITSVVVTLDATALAAVTDPGCLWAATRVAA